MLAVVRDRFGSPDFLELREIDRPIIRDDEVLLRVHAASVNAADWHLLRRLPHLVGRLMGVRATRVVGRDMAGRVDAVGRKVRRFAPGDAVFGAGLGAFAEYGTATEDRLAPKPRNLTFEQAAAIPTAGCTALQGLRDSARLRAGQRVLVYGAGGGVGIFAVQIAVFLGARVTAVTSADKVDLMRTLGAAEVLDYAHDDCTDGRQHYDVVFDIGANRALESFQRVLTPGGTHVLAGAPPGLRAPLSRLLKSRLKPGDGKRVVSLLARVNHEDLTFLKDLAEHGSVVPVIDRHYPLSGVPDALRHLGTRQARGKVVINVATGTG
jgi:NADPH:quinone reductase-like Zn-dependent oxidoreductase